MGSNPRSHSEELGVRTGKGGNTNEESLSGQGGRVVGGGCGGSVLGVQVPLYHCMDQASGHCSGIATSSCS